MSLAEFLMTPTCTTTLLILCIVFLAVMIADIVEEG